MILFADSGATKTSWLLYDQATGNKQYFESRGINPVVQKHHEINDIVGQAQDLLKHNNEVEAIHFFGAGCSSAERNAIVADVLQLNFKNAKVYVDHDMKAAGIAVCGGKPGIACILGTGSNSILYDGEKWYGSKVGIGYVLGDEGSGAYLGKQLLRDFIYGILPKEMEQYLKDTYRLDKELILENVYKKLSPNRYLAGFGPVLSEFRKTEYVQQLLHFSFSEFFKYGVTSYKNYQQYPVGFVGSIAKYFDVELKQVAGEYGCTLGKFVQKPIDEIADYFINKM